MKDVKNKEKGIPDVPQHDSEQIPDAEPGEDNPRTPQKED